MDSVSLLPFHYEILQELNSADGLCIQAAGIGWSKPVAAFLKAHAFAPNGGSVLLLGLKPFQKQALESELRRHDAEAILPVEINNSVSAVERLVLYRSAGSLYVTPRILVVDLLMEKIPPEAFAGIFVMNAERVCDNSGVEFVIRLYRKGNKSGFVRGITDQPVTLVGGFNQVSHSLMGSDATLI